MADDARAKLAEIHKLADTGSYWACGEKAAPTLTRARIRTLAREAEAEIERLLAERDAQVREAFERGFSAGDVRAYTDVADAWKADQMRQRYLATRERPASDVSVG